MSESGQYILKLAVLGDAGVGKTSLVNQFVSASFKEDYRATLGVNIVMKIIKATMPGFLNIRSVSFFISFSPFIFMKRFPWCHCVRACFLNTPLSPPRCLQFLAVFLMQFFSRS